MTYPQRFGGSYVSFPFPLPIVNCGAGVVDGVVSDAQGVTLLGDRENSEVEAGPAQGTARAKCMCRRYRRRRWWQEGLRRGLVIAFELQARRSADRHEISVK